MPDLILTYQERIDNEIRYMDSLTDMPEENGIAIDMAKRNIAEVAYGIRQFAYAVPSDYWNGNDFTEKWLMDNGYLDPEKIK